MSHPLVIIGWCLLAVAVLLYVGSIVSAVLRIGKQYSRAMSGSGSLRLGAALAAAGRRWYFLVPGLIGALMVVLGK